jgi:hypothetical protein
VSSTLLEVLEVLGVLDVLGARDARRALRGRAVLAASALLTACASAGDTSQAPGQGGAASAPTVPTAALDAPTSAASAPPSMGTSVSTAPLAASTLAPPTASAPGPSVSASPARPAGPPCEVDDDCWIASSPSGLVPIRRPSHLRGRRFKPCSDGESAPACLEGRCALRKYRC